MRKEFIIIKFSRKTKEKDINDLKELLGILEKKYHFWWRLEVKEDDS